MYTFFFYTERSLHLFLAEPFLNTLVENALVFFWFSVIQEMKTLT